MSVGKALSFTHELFSFSFFFINPPCSAKEQKTRLNVFFVLCKNLDRSLFRFVIIHAFDRRTVRILSVCLSVFASVCL